MPSKTQGAELHNYFPELAAYMNTFASQSWFVMFNKVKSIDISSMDPQIVKSFFETVCIVQFSFDPADPAT